MYYVKFSMFTSSFMGVINGYRHTMGNFLSNCDSGYLQYKVIM